MTLVGPVLRNPSLDPPISYLLSDTLALLEYSILFYNANSKDPFNVQNIRK